VLGPAGYTVLEAATGEEALEILHESDGVALLFTDVVMPGLSGPELLKRARELHPRLKVLFASGYAAETLAHHDVTADPDQFLEKPYTVDELKRKVREVLDT
ncbi:MAG: response regulator, partial [Gemmatimonadota bacterium]